MSKTILVNALIVKLDGIHHGSIVIDAPFIESAGNDYADRKGDNVIDVHGAYILPGIIDTHVHFREPGMTHKGTMASESRAAAAGGVTSILEMPNCNPTTTTLEALHDKQERAKRDCIVNHAFFIGATHDNLDVLKTIDYTTVPGIKVFMGSSTGGMLLDNAEALNRVFSLSPDIPIVTHCEDTTIINHNALIYGDSTDFSCHPLIRSREACLASTRLAISLAHECNTRLHIAHVSTKEEIALFPQNNSTRSMSNVKAPTTQSTPIPSHIDNRITAEICVPHLLFTDADYARLGARIKCNPAIKTIHDRDALRQALVNGQATTIGTDHAPHLLSEKMTGGCLTAPSGMPMLQFSLAMMLNLVNDNDSTHSNNLSLSRLSELMSTNPARLFGIEKRGEIKAGNYADLVIVRACDPYTIQDRDALSLCAWTPLSGTTIHHRIVATYINGQQVWDGKHIIGKSASLPLKFRL